MKTTELLLAIIILAMNTTFKAPGMESEPYVTDVSTLCDLRNQTGAGSYRLTGIVIVTYEESRPGGNWKFVQDATCGILIEDRLNVLPGTYYEGTALINLYGTLDNSGIQLKFIPDCCNSPLISSTGNVVTPIPMTYDEYYAKCYNEQPPVGSNMSLQYESMLVTVTSPMIVFDDYYHRPNWEYDNMDLATKNALADYNWFIQNVFNSGLIGTVIPTAPCIYTGIRTNVNWGNSSVPHIYGLFTPRSLADISPVNSPKIVIQAVPPISNVTPGLCKSVDIKIYNEGVGNTIVNGLNLVNGTSAGEFQMVNPPIPPFVLGTWTNQTVRIDFCPLNLGNESIDLMVDWGSGQTIIATINGTTIPATQPDAQFDADNTIINAGDPVNFTCLSTGYPDSWTWDFPGSAQSTSLVKDPVGIVYPSDGMFPVKLIASNGIKAGERIKTPYLIVGPQAYVPALTETFTILEMKSSSTLPGKGWNFVDKTGMGMGWQVRKTGVGGCFTQEDPMPSTSGAGGYLVLPADEYNCVNGIQSANKVDASAESPSFDCSGFDAVIFSFEQRFRVCCDTPLMQLQVSNDGGTTWVVFDILKGRSQNTLWGDPVENLQINITEVAQHQSNVKVRFYWKGSAGYFWMIDDIVVKGIKACQNFNISIAGNSKIYKGYAPLDESSLSAIIQGGVLPYQYLWSTGETTPAITVAPLKTTEYTVEVTDIQGCKQISAITVTVKDVRCGPKFDKVAMCKKNINGKPTSICVSPNAAHAQLLAGATLGSCQQIPGMEGNTSATEFAEPDLIVYPNPGNGRFTVNLTGWTDERLLIEVRDVLGRIAYRKDAVNPGNQGSHFIELTQSGLYYLTVKGSSAILSRQVSVIR